MCPRLILYEGHYLKIYKQNGSLLSVCIGIVELI